MDNYATPLRGKLFITGTMKLLTGLHIGASSDFSAIGAVDMVVVRDPLTRQPIIPGSSIKGKMRSLLARNIGRGPSYKIEDEPDELKRLFGGAAAQGKSRQLIPARLQFFDVFMTAESVERLKKAPTDLYLTEIKFENTINRLTGEATPRQLERVPAGAEFDFRLVYNIEDESQLEEDFNNLGLGLKLLQMDYLGKGGTRGNGRIAFSNFTVEMVSGEGLNVDPVKLSEKLTEAVESYALLHA